MKLAEILATPDDWTKQTFQRVHPLTRRMSYCLAGALMAQAQARSDVRTVWAGWSDLPPVTRVLADIIDDLFPDRAKNIRAMRLGVAPGLPGRLVAAFNDHPDTTFDDVHRVAAEFDRRYALLAEPACR